MPRGGGLGASPETRRELRAFFSDRSDGIGQVVVLSEHAVKRYRERFPPGLSKRDPAQPYCAVTCLSAEKPPGPRSRFPRDAIRRPKVART